MKQPDVCPKCGSDNGLNYYSSEIADDNVYYPYQCDDCGFEGQEHYKMKFIGHYNNIHGIGDLME